MRDVKDTAVISTLKDITVKTDINTIMNSTDIGVRKDMVNIKVIIKDMDYNNLVDRPVPFTAPSTVMSISALMTCFVLEINGCRRVVLSLKSMVFVVSLMTVMLESVKLLNTVMLFMDVVKLFSQ
jgi:hypothetical protein